MAYDGSGNYSLPPGSIVSDGTTIDAADHNVPTTDIAAALSQVLLRSGVAPMTGDLDLGGFDVVNAGGAGGTFLTEDDIGTSGHKIPQLDVANTWSAVQTFTAAVNANGGGVLGDAAADTVVIKGTTVTPFGATLLSADSATGLRSYLGLGTASIQNTGTSGATVPLLNGDNVWSKHQTISYAVGGDWMFATLASDKVAVLSTWISAYFFDGNTQICGSITHTSGGPSVLGTTTYGSISDGRLKTGRRPIDNSGDIIDQLNPIYFNWGDTARTDFGFVAQEVDAVVPGIVVKGDDGPYRGGFPGQGGSTPWQMQHGRLEAILVAEIKALRARVAALEAALP